MPWLFTGMMTYLPIIGALSGVMLIISGLMIHSNTKNAAVWGSIAIVFSILGFLGGGGFLIGSLVGLVGGILLLTQYQ